MRKLHVEFEYRGPDESRVRVIGLEQEYSLFLRTNGELALDMTAWLPMLLPVALSTGSSLHLHGPVAAVALTGSVRAGRLLASWFERLTFLGVEADETFVGQRSSGSASMFSGGVDSFHTALRRDPGHLLFVHGFDIPVDDLDLFRQVKPRLVAAAEELGKELVTAETNLRTLANRFAVWGEHAHGGAIAGVALGHAPMWGEIFVGSTHSPSERKAFGSHPDLDWLWSSSGVTLVHDAAEYDRAMKIAEIADHEVPWRYLRVCWRNPDGAYNCGRCEKCVRTIIALRVAGVLDRCETLPTMLTPELVRSIKVKPSLRQMTRTSRDALNSIGETELANAVSVIIRRSYLDQARRAMRARVARPLKQLRRIISCL